MGHVSTHAQSSALQEDAIMVTGDSHAGERNPNHHLTARQVAAIRKYAERPGLFYGWKSALARRYAVSPGTIGDILHGRRW